MRSNRERAVKKNPTNAHAQTSTFLVIGGKIGGSIATSSGRIIVPTTTTMNPARRGWFCAKISAEIGIHRKNTK